MTDPSAAVLSAMTTEHFVLQGALSATVSEASGRSSLYVMALSSSLVAMGFLAQSQVFVPFVVVILPCLFLLGVFTVIRLIDTALEAQQYLGGIARIRAYYRALSPDAARLFSAPSGRWPEAASSPALSMGVGMAFLGTSATMIAFINNVVAGAAVGLLVRMLAPASGLTLPIAAGGVTFVAMCLAFLAFQRWRFSHVALPPMDIPGAVIAEEPGTAHVRHAPDAMGPGRETRHAAGS